MMQVGIQNAGGVDEVARGETGWVGVEGFEVGRNKEGRLREEEVAVVVGREVGEGGGVKSVGAKCVSETVSLLMMKVRARERD